jgi:hypothetical protein
MYLAQPKASSYHFRWKYHSTITCIWAAIGISLQFFIDKNFLLTFMPLTPSVRLSLRQAQDDMVSLSNHHDEALSLLGRGEG